MRKKTSQLKNYIVATNIFIIAVVMGILVFFAGVQHSVDKNSQKTMMNNVARQSEHLRTILAIHYQYLNELAKEMGQDEELISQEHLDMLASIYESTDLERTALIEPDGTAHYDNGVVKNVSHRRYFKDAINGQQTLSDPLESSVDQETRVVLGVPIYDKNQQVIGVLGASYNVTTLSHMLFDDLFDGEGDTLIVTQTGKIITYEDGNANKKQIEYGDNLFTYYAEKNKKQENTLGQVQDDFLSNESGFIRLCLDNTQTKDYYMTYMSIGMNDWMLCYIVPVKAAQKSYAFIREYEMIFMLAFCVLVSILVIYIVRKNNREKVKILEAAQRDALTGLYNKDHTQKFIEQILQKESGPHGFVILDIDYFKSVNDSYGHLVGDKVLSMLGKFLESQFREDDIVGRIGGDEFVILMRNISDRDKAEQRIHNLLKNLPEMKIEEMDNRGITISVGVALAPDNGNSFIELYRHADQALYETKRVGRNGYSIYNPNWTENVTEE